MVHGYTVEDIQTSYMTGHGGFKNFSTLSLLGDMMAWLSGDPSEENLAALDFGHIRPDGSSTSTATRGDLCATEVSRGRGTGIYSCSPPLHSFHYSPAARVVNMCM